MNTKWLLGIVFILIVMAAGFLAFSPKTQAPVVTNPPVATTTQPAMLDDLIVVDSPLPGTTLISAMNSVTITVTGKARGNWYFEATAPVELTNVSGTSIASGHITAQGDWMTTDYVPFSGTFTFPLQPAGSVGTLVLRNDNPSGDPAKEKALKIPVQF